MHAMPSPQHVAIEMWQRNLSRREAFSSRQDRAVAEQPAVFIRGDIRLSVSEARAASGSITGCYSIETAGMQELLYAFWQAEGQVHSNHTQSTTIAFDARGARAGETRTYLVAVQVAESGEPGRVVQCGVFVQIRVSEDPPGKAAQGERE